MGIFTNAKENKTEHFNQVTAGLSDKKKRKAEEALLHPEPIKKYSGKMPKHRSEIHSRTALIVFKSKEEEELLGTLLSIRVSATNGITYITDISVLSSIASGIKEGLYEVVDNRVQVVPNKKEVGVEIGSMREYQAKFFPKDVGKICFECGSTYSKEKKYTEKIASAKEKSECVKHKKQKEKKVKRKRRNLA